MSAYDDFPIHSFVKVKNPLPIEAYDDPYHLIHTMPISAKLEVMDYWNDGNWVIHLIVLFKNIDSSSTNIIVNHEWVEKFEEIPDYEEIFKRKRDENLRQMCSSED